MNLGTLVVGPREHIVAVADLGDTAVAELGPVLRDTARVVEALCQPEQTYVSLWSHGAAVRKHLHIAVQPVTAAVVARYGDLRSEQLQAACWQAATSQTPLTRTADTMEEVASCRRPASYLRITLLSSPNVSAP
jgi:diadenosine tetraphosphate (Ap4A) HIT family hydrolase